MSSMSPPPFFFFYVNIYGFRYDIDTGGLTKVVEDAAPTRRHGAGPRTKGCKSLAP